jgi:Amt family ammonium transporter
LFSWIATYAGYFIGFGLMFSSTAGNWGLIGLHWPLWPESVIGINGDRGMEFFLFQAAFAATAATIPSGAIAERMSLPGYLLIGFLIALVIYPVFGHWAWGGSLHADELVKATPAVQGWLRRIGFHDFAGSTVVHSIGGWIALIAALTLGPRKGRFQNGLVNVDDFPSRSRGYAFLGVFLLWFGWWGFNGGSQLKYDTSIANIILKTNIAGAAAGFAAWIFACWQKNRAQGRLQLHKDGFIPEKVIGGTLGGLVAITASCDQGNPLGALLIGLAAGVIHNLVFDWLLRREIDDPVGAVPVHLGCGMWGTFCAAFTSSFSWKSVGVQLLGIVIAGGWAVLMGLVLFYLPKRLGKWKPVGEDRLQRVLNLEF